MEQVMTQPQPYMVIGYHTQISAPSTAQAIVVPENAGGVLIQAITQNIRITMDNFTAPTATRGFQIKAGDPAVYIPAVRGTQIRIIQEAASATVEYQFVRGYSNVG